MKQIAPFLTAAVFAMPAIAPVAAQEPEPGTEAPQSEGRGLMEDGARRFLEGLMQEMNPAIEELEGLARELGPQLRDFADAMGPALRDILSEVEDWSAYAPPEILPNGDIIIRRKPDAPESEPSGGDTEEPIDL